MGDGPFTKTLVRNVGPVEYTFLLTDADNTLLHRGYPGDPGVEAFVSHVAKVVTHDGGLSTTVTARLV